MSPQEEDAGTASAVGARPRASGDGGRRPGGRAVPPAGRGHGALRLPAARGGLAGHAGRHEAQRPADLPPRLRELRVLQRVRWPLDDCTACRADVDLEPVMQPRVPPLQPARMARPARLRAPLISCSQGSLRTAQTGTHNINAPP